MFQVKFQNLHGPSRWLFSIYSVFGLYFQAHEVDTHFSTDPQNVGLVFSHLFMNKACLTSDCLAPTVRFHGSWIENIRIPESSSVSLKMIFLHFGPPECRCDLHAPMTNIGPGEAHCTKRRHVLVL